jgi:DNA-binding CsgD family transcriptional regulator
MGLLDDARVVAERLRDRSERQEHPWGLAGAGRCHASIELATGGDADAALGILADAAAEYERLGLRFDEARTRLLAGRAERRLRRWASARRSLEAAAAVFDEIGSTGWADEARPEIERLGGRRPRADGELTPAERRAAELAAQGLSNKEIAQALSVTVNTVERHLSHVYAKLGVRGRSQLTRHASAGQ